MFYHRILRSTLIPLGLAIATSMAVPATRAASQGPVGTSSVRDDSKTVQVLSRNGSRIRIENRQWVSGTVVEFMNNVTVRITDVGQRDSGAVITEGEVEPSDQLAVRAISVQVAPLQVGGMPPLLRAIVRERVEHLPILMVEEVQGVAPDLSFAVVEDRLEVLSRDGSLRHQFPLGTDTEDRVMDFMLRELALRQLSVLDNPLAPFAVKLVVGGKPARSADGNASEGVAVGGDLTVRVTSERSGYLTLLNLSPDGSVDLLTPNLYGETYVEAGTEMVIPDPSSDLAFRVEYPTGIGLLRAIVTPAPLTFRGAPYGTALPDVSAFFAKLEEQLGVFLEDSRIRIEHDPAADWSSALMLYHVFDPY